MGHLLRFTHLLHLLSFLQLGCWSWDKPCFLDPDRMIVSSSNDINQLRLVLENALPLERFHAFIVGKFGLPHPYTVALGQSLRLTGVGADGSAFSCSKEHKDNGRRLFRVTAGARLHVTNMTLGHCTLSLFSSKVKVYSGGMIYIDKGSTMVLEDVIVTTNRADSGGAIFAVTSWISFRGRCTFRKNRATQVPGWNPLGLDGGVIKQRSAYIILANLMGVGSLTLEGDIVLEHNSAMQVGGVWEFMHGQVYIYGKVTCRYNFATRGGCFHFNTGAKIYVNGSLEITRNKAFLDGGAMYVNECVTHIFSHTKFSYNYAVGRGGGAYVDESRIYIYQKLECFHNRGREGGGCFHAWRGRIYVEKSGYLSCVRNTCYWTRGGCLDVAIGTLVNHGFVKVLDNKCRNGGGLGFFRMFSMLQKFFNKWYNYGELAIVSNSAWGGNGGGIDMGETIFVNRGILKLYRNSARYWGGAMCLGLKSYAHLYGELYVENNKQGVLGKHFKTHQIWFGTGSAAKVKPKKQKWIGDTGYDKGYVRYHHLEKVATQLLYDIDKNIRSSDAIEEALFGKSVLNVKRKDRYTRSSIPNMKGKNKMSDFVMKIAKMANQKKGMKAKYGTVSFMGLETNFALPF